MQGRSSQGTQAQAIDIGERRGPTPGYGFQYAGTPGTPSNVGPYGRSVTYNAATPVMPANFR